MPSATDRRKWVRHLTNPLTTCYLAIDQALVFTALAVCDVAEGGVCLLVDIPVPVGQALTLQLSNPAARILVQWPARVAYCLPAGGGFAVGATFARNLGHYDVVELG